MKSPAAAAVMLTFVLSVAFFQTCFSLRCHRCISIHHSNPDCYKIKNENYLMDCGNWNSVCFTAQVMGPVLRTGIVRDCITLPNYHAYKKKMEAEARAEVMFQADACGYDGCNDNND